MQNTTIGVAIMLLATSLTNVGAVVQKKAVDGLPAFDRQPIVESVKSVFTAPLWLFGWFLGVSGIVLNMIALSFADISIIQPLNGFGLVVLALSSRLLLGENLGKQAFVGITSIIVGVSLVGFFTPPSRVFADSSELFSSYTHLTAILAILFLIGCAFVLFAIARKFELVAGVFYALVAALCSVLGLTFAKGFFGILTLEGFLDSFLVLSSYSLLSLLLVFSISAMALQQLSFQKGRAVVVTPIFAATSVLLPLFSGRMVFNEQLTPATLFAAFLIVVGVVLLGMRSQPSPPPSPLKDFNDMPYHTNEQLISLVNTLVNEAGKRALSFEVGQTCEARPIVAVQVSALGR